jgi:hypothetical protein
MAVTSLLPTGAYMLGLEKIMLKNGEAFYGLGG